MGNKYLHTWCGRREENLIFKRGRGAWNTNTSYSASTYVLLYRFPISHEFQPFSNKFRGPGRHYARTGKPSILLHVS
jgi:hypothetical protein